MRGATDHRGHHVVDAEDRRVGRVAWGLAALTTTLIAALLLVLGGALYVTTQSALLHSLQSTVGRQGDVDANHFVDLVNEGRDTFERTEGAAAGIFVIAANPQLHVLGGSLTPFGNALPDPAAARSARRGRQPLFTTRTLSGNETYLIYSRPVFRGNHIIGIVQAGTSEHQYRDSLETLLRELLLIGGVGLLASAGISVFLARRALLPIRVALRRQRDFVADAAHELRTPLTVIRAAVELGLEAGTESEESTALEQALVQTNHLTHLVDDLSFLARADSGALALGRSPVDLAGLVQQTVASLEILAEDRDIHLEICAPQQIRVMGNAGRLRQLIMILLDNALKYTPDAGTITVDVGRRGSQARLQVQDTGPGINPEALPYLFDRFFRAERARSGGGTGLGLAIGRWIVEAHGGHISAANNLQGGAVFTVLLPAAQSP